METLPSGFKSILSRSPILNRIGNIEDLQYVQHTGVDLLSNDDDDTRPGWWSSLTYPNYLNCTEGKAAVVTGIRTNICIASARESFYLYCNSGIYF